MLAVPNATEELDHAVAAVGSESLGATVSNHGGRDVAQQVHRQHESRFDGKLIAEYQLDEEPRPTEAGAISSCSCHLQSEHTIRIVSLMQSEGALT